MLRNKTKRQERFIFILLKETSSVKNLNRFVKLLSEFQEKSLEQNAYNFSTKTIRDLRFSTFKTMGLKMQTNVKRKKCQNVFYANYRNKVEKTGNPFYKNVFTWKVRLISAYYELMRQTKFGTGDRPILVPYRFGSSLSSII